MMKKPISTKVPAEQVVKDFRRATRKLHSPEEKIQIMLSGLRGEDSIAELCRKEGIAQRMYNSWSKESLEAGKKRLAGDTARQADTGEVKGLRAETLALKELLYDLSLENRLLKQEHERGWGRPRMRYPAGESGVSVVRRRMAPVVSPLVRRRQTVRREKFRSGIGICRLSGPKVRAKFTFQRGKQCDGGPMVWRRYCFWGSSLSIVSGEGGRSGSQ